MDVFEIGDTLILDENEEYKIIDILNIKKNNYFFCCTTKKPIKPEVLEYKIEDDELVTRKVVDKIVLYRVIKIILNKYGAE